MENKKRAKLIIFTGPSGVGKGTILADFFKKVDCIRRHILLSFPQEYREAAAD